MEWDMFSKLPLTELYVSYGIEYYDSEDLSWGILLAEAKPRTVIGKSVNHFLEDYQASFQK